MSNNSESEAMEAIRLLYKLLVNTRNSDTRSANEKNDAQFAPIGQPNSIVYETCVLVGALVDTVVSNREQITNLNGEIAQLQSQQLALANSLATCGLKRNGGNVKNNYASLRQNDGADNSSPSSSFEKNVKSATTIFDLNLSFPTYEKLMKMVINSNDNIVQYANVGHPTIPLVWFDTLHYTEFKNKFFNGDETKAMFWLSSVLIRTVVKSNASNTLLDNTVDTYSKFLDIIRLSTSDSNVNPPPDDYTGHVQAFLTITDRIITAILDIEQTDAWFQWYLRNSKNHSIAEKILRFIYISTTVKMNISRSSETARNQDRNLNNLMMNLAYDVDTQINQWPHIVYNVENTKSLYDKFVCLINKKGVSREFVLERENSNLYKLMNLL